MSIDYKRNIEASEGPKEVMISPTDRCNLSCEMCWRQEKEEMSFEKGMGLKTIKDILKSCRSLGVNKLDFTGGGEPFLRADMLQILEAGSDFFTSLTTNGTLLAESKLRELIKVNLDEISFSIDSPREATNNTLRGEGSFNKVVSSIQLLQKLKEQQKTCQVSCPFCGNIQ